MVRPGQGVEREELTLRRLRAGLRRYVRAMSAITDEREFLDLVEPLRREILAHCYRMTGSLHDAEDLVQETYLRAWRAMHGLESRGSLRAWLYRIATNTCLTHLEGRRRRPLPTGLGTTPADPRDEPVRNHGVPWLEPLPDALVWGAAPVDPAERTVARDSVRLAFVAALQHLTAQQRAVLLLRDVLAMSAAETAEALDLTVAGVNSTLQRARAHVGELDAGDQDELPDDDGRRRRLLDEYVAAFERYDVPAIVELLRADAVWEMPPFPQWYRGAEQIGDLISNWCPATGPESQRMRATTANGLPALGLYMLSDDGRHQAFQLQQLTVRGGRVAHVTAWFGPGLFTKFGLPEVLEDE